MMSNFFKAIEKGDIHNIRSLLYENVKLLFNNPNFNPSDNDNFALRNALDYNHLDLVKLLLADPRVDPSVDNNYALRYAVEYGYLDLVKQLLADPRVDPSSNSSIRRASIKGYAEIVKLLLSDPRIDPSANDNYAIGVSSSTGHIEVVKLLLSDPRVDPSGDDNYAIKYASQDGYTEIVKLLLSDPRVDPSAANNYAIRYASENGYIEVIKLLLSDPRTDWRVIDENMKIRLLKDEDVDLKDELKTSLLTINRITPKMRIETSEEGQGQKALIPKSVRKNISYRAPYEELCSLIKGEIPPIKLIALANLLKIQYDQNINWKELCGKVKFRLLEML